MSVEGFRFEPEKPPKFPALIMRAYVGENQFIEWIFTPPNDAGWFDYKFEAKQDNGVLHINFDHSIMTPRAG